MLEVKCVRGSSGRVPAAGALGFRLFPSDGGLQAALATGVPGRYGEERVEVTEPYPVQDWLLPTATIEEVAEAVQNADKVVVDVRDAYRYRVESEPIDLVAGYISTSHQYSIYP